MKFRKIKVENKRSSQKFEDESTYWTLILDNVEDLYTYLKHDSKCYYETLISLRREPTDKEFEYSNIRLDHLSSHREHTIGIVVRSKLFSQEEIVVLPHEVLGEIIQGKGKDMLHHIKNLGPIQISANGGWCGVSSFDELYSPKILEEIEKEDCALPSNSEPICTNYLVLENGNEVPPDFRKFVKEYFNLYDYRSIRLLKDKDPKWVVESIKLSQNIVFQTNAVDLNQIDSFMKIFTKIDKKGIYIRTNNKKDIVSHPLYEINSSKHNIVFI